MVKLPGKVDDISKTASSLIGDDFPSDKSKQKAVFQLKTKHKTNFDDAVAEVTVDVDNGLPGKLSFKFPKPFSFLPGFAIDKFELDAGGKIALDCSGSKGLHGVDGLKTEVKSVLDKQTFAAHATYTGIADTQLKVEVEKKSDQDVSTAAQGVKAEVLHGLGAGVIGAKIDKSLCPDVSASIESGDLIASLALKNKFSEFTGHAHYKVSDDIKVAATFDVGGKKSGQWAVAASHKYGDIHSKAKFTHDFTASAAFKKDLAKGTTFHAGVGYNINSSNMEYGFKLNIE